MRLLTFFAALALIFMPFNTALAQTQRIVALGDSLTAGYGLTGGQDFASRLEAALKADGLDVKVDNAGVSGDTTAGGKSRLEWAVSGEPKPSLVILALGANDMLRGIDPSVTRSNLSDMIADLQKRDIPVLLAGMRSLTNLGPLFRGKFDRVYPELAKEYDVPLYPFFLEGVALDARYNLDDGLHPNPEGVEIMVHNILPSVKKALK